MKQEFFIQVDGNNNITQATQDNHQNDSNWIEVVVPKFELNAFKQHYNECKYDPVSGAWIPPKDFAEDAALSNDATGKGIVAGLNDRIKKVEDAVQLNDDVQPETITDTNVYGAEWNRVANPTLTRIDSAQGMDSTFHNGINDFDAAGPWQWKKVQDSMGNVFMRIPKMYLKKTQTGSLNNGKVTWEVSLRPFAGSYLPRCFVQFDSNSNAIGELPYVDVGVYDAGLQGSQLTSKSHVGVLNNHGINDFRQYARNDGAGYQLLDVHVWDLLRTLFVIEFATLSSDSVFVGRRSGNSPENTGVTDGLPGNSGQTSDKSFKLHGIEDMYSSNLQQWCDGVNFDLQTGRQIWVCDDANKYASQFYAYPYQRVGYDWSAWDDAESEGLDPKHPEINLNNGPQGTPGGTHQYYCDYQGGWAGFTVAFVGSTWADADNGIFCVYVGTPTTAWAGTGSRLVRKAQLGA